MNAQERNLFATSKRLQLPAGKRDAVDFVKRIGQESSPKVLVQTATSRSDQTEARSFNATRNAERTERRSIRRITPMNWRTTAGPPVFQIDASGTGSTCSDGRKNTRSDQRRRPSKLSG